MEKLTLNHYNPKVQEEVPKSLTMHQQPCKIIRTNWSLATKHRKTNLYAICLCVSLEPLLKEVQSLETLVLTNVESQNYLRDLGSPWMF